MTSVETITVFEMVLPILADLGDGWKLAAVKAGPIITNGSLMATLASPSDAGPPKCRSCEEPLECRWCHEDIDSEGDIIELPESVRYKAVEAYCKLSWPHVKHLF